MPTKVPKLAEVKKLVSFTFCIKIVNIKNGERSMNHG